jgi:hypothetical protein
MAQPLSLSAKKQRAREFLKKAFEFIDPILQQIEKSKEVKVIDDPNIKIYDEFKELKQTIEKVKIRLSPFNDANCPITEPLLVNCIRLKLEQIHKNLAILEDKISSVAFADLKTKIYTADFIVYQEIEHILALFTPELIRDPIDMFKDVESKSMWATCFGREVRSSHSIL